VYSAMAKILRDVPIPSEDRPDYKGTVDSLALIVLVVGFCLLVLLCGSVHQ
jgi:hypothetical protein